MILFSLLHICMQKVFLHPGVCEKIVVLDIVFNNSVVMMMTQ